MAATEPIKGAIVAAALALPGVLPKALAAGVFEAELLLQREIAERTPVGAHGLLRNSIQAAVPTVLADRVSGAVGSPLEYVVSVELGTKPHFPPLMPLVDWVEAKLGLRGDEAKGAAFGIARKIAKKGTEGVRMFEEAFGANADQVKAILVRRTRQVLAAMGREVPA